MSKQIPTMPAAESALPTGIAGLDAILNGGLVRPALVVVIGPPGAGKTILASKVIFHAASQGLQSLIFTSFSEGVTQYIQHLRTLDFFDYSQIGTTIQLFTLASQLKDEDTSPAAAIARTIRASAAKVVLLDGFQNIESPSMQTQELLAALATQIRFLDTTIIITLAGNARDRQFYSVMTAADIVLSLNYGVVGRRHERLLEVVKIRGRRQRPGLHSYRIDVDGVMVFPRIEGYEVPSAPARSTERAPFRLPELDQLLSGGLNVGTTTVLAGAPGVGKTTLGLYWALADARPDAVTLFLTFAEHLDQLQLKAAAFGLDLSAAVANESVRVVRLSAVDLNPDEVAAVLLAELAARPVQRLIIDDLAVLLHELGERTRDYLGALNDIVYGANITSLFLLEISPFEGLRLNITNTPLALLGDNVIVVQQYEIGGQLRRLLAVLRMRLSFFDRTLRELVLDARGVRIMPAAESDTGVLASGAELGGGVAPAAEPPAK